MVTWLGVLCTFVQLLLNPPDIERMKMIVAAGDASAHEAQHGNIDTVGTQPPPRIIEVYVTPTGQCYHRRNCSYLGENVKAIPLDQAVGKYRPCSRCKPPVAAGP